jgi:hypothetical protein
MARVGKIQHMEEMMHGMLSTKMWMVDKDTGKEYLVSSCVKDWVMVSKHHEQLVGQHQRLALLKQS